MIHDTSKHSSTHTTTTHKHTTRSATVIGKPGQLQCTTHIHRSAPCTRCPPFSARTTRNRDCCCSQAWRSKQETRAKQTTAPDHSQQHTVHRQIPQGCKSARSLHLRQWRASIHPSSTTTTQRPKQRPRAKDRSNPPSGLVFFLRRYSTVRGSSGATPSGAMADSNTAALAWRFVDALFCGSPRPRVFTRLWLVPLKSLYTLTFRSWCRRRAFFFSSWGLMITLCHTKRRHNELHFFSAPSRVNKGSSTRNALLIG